MTFNGTMIDTIHGSDVACAQIAEAGELGLNAVRWQVIWGSAPVQVFTEDMLKNLIFWNLDTIEKCRDVLERYDIDVIVVLMTPPGGYGGNRARIFTKKDNAEFVGQLVSGWKYIAERTGSDSHIMAFEILNEPEVKSVSEYLAVMQNVVDEIRLVTDKQIFIPVPGTTLENFKKMKPLKGTNLCYVGHDYEETPITHYKIGKNKRFVKYKSKLDKVFKRFKHMISFRDRNQECVAVTEFGHSKFNEENQYRWTKDELFVLSKFNLSWVWNGVSQSEGNVFKPQRETLELLREEK